MNLERSAWPAHDLPVALAALTGRPILPSDGQALDVAVAYGREPVPVDWSGPPTAALVGAVAPGWCRTPGGGYLLVVRRLAGWVRLLGPHCRTWARAAAVVPLLTPPPEPSAHAVAHAPEIRPGRRARAMQALSPTSVVGDGACVRLLPAPAAPIRRQLHVDGLIGWLATALLAIVIGYLAVAGHWTFAGHHLLTGEPAGAWLLGWAAIAGAAVVARVGGQHALGEAAVRLGAWWKRRSLTRALQLNPDTVHRAGPGLVLGRTFDIDAAEAGLVGGAAVALVGGIEVVVAAGLIALTPAGTPALLALLAYLACAAAAAAAILGRKHAWARARTAVSARLTEQLLEHRSRLVQGLPHGDDQHAHAERIAADGAGHRLDRLLAGWLAVLPTAWLALALTVLAVSWWPQPPTIGGAAAGLGAVLLAASGLEALAVAWDDTSDAVVALAPEHDLLSPHGPTADDAAAAPPRPSPPTPAAALITAYGITVTYPDRDEPCLNGFGLAVQREERVLLHGPSGAGKSTAIAVLAGHLTPAAGTVTRKGRVVAVPQAHRNYLFSSTFAFNLLLGRAWPPKPSDLDAAEKTCRLLDLGGLLDAMPAGLHQPVGETGWQLSDGERARVFAARALLQKPDLTILDESLGALDPITAAHCRDAIADQEGAVLLTHHP